MTNATYATERSASSPSARSHTTLSRSKSKSWTPIVASIHFVNQLEFANFP